MPHTNERDRYIEFQVQKKGGKKPELCFENYVHVYIPRYVQGKSTYNQVTEKTAGMTLFRVSTLHMGSTRWRSWLSHCATSLKVAGSIPDGVIGIFH